MGGQDTQNIGDMIRKLADKGDEVYSVICTVKSVDGNFADLTPIDGNADILGVNLIAGDSDTPMLITPKVDSFVIATFLSKDTAFISTYSEIDSVEIRGKEFGGLVKVKDLVDKINALETKVNDILTALKGITVPLAPSGTYPLAPSFATILNLNKTKKSDLENDKVQHG